MRTQQREEVRKDIEAAKRYKEIPVVNIRIMSDDEWNRLAYRNRLERTGGKDS